MKKLVIGIFSFLMSFGTSVYASDTVLQTQVKLEKLSAPALKLINTAFEGIAEGENVDFHVHVVGYGDRVTLFEDELGTSQAAGCRKNDFAGHPVYINENRFSFWGSPGLHIKTRYLMEATGITKGLFSRFDREEANNNYVRHLLELVANYRPGSNKAGKFLLLAMDGHYEDGVIDWQQTDLLIPNDFVITLSDCMNRLYQHRYGGQFSPFMPAISIHPERGDAIAELEKHSADAKYLKWLPNTMNINPASAKINSFLQEMKAREVTLITHTGHESATEAQEEHQRFGNPTLHQAALDLGVEVIMAHAGYKGTSHHHDHGEEHQNSQLFNHMLQRYPDNLKGGLSATVFIEHSNCAADLGHSCKRDGAPLVEQLKRLLLDEDQLYAGRMVNGSDFPLPSIYVLKRTRELMYRGFFTPQQAELLDEIWRVNPLLYDFVLKRTLRHPQQNDKGFPASLF